MKTAGAIILLWLMMAPVAGAQSEIDDAMADGHYDAAIVLIDRQLRVDPERPMLRLTRANALSYSGRHDEALEELDRLRKKHPGNVDFAFARAQVLSRLGRTNEALEELDSAIELAPDYEALWQARDRLLAARSDPESAVRRGTYRIAAMDRFPKSSYWRRSADVDGIAWRADAGLSLDDLSDGFDSWTHQFVEISRSRPEHNRVSLRLGRNTRGSESDVSGGLSVDRSFSESWTAGARIDIAGNPAFLPEYDFTARLGRAFDKGWATELRYRRREYPSDHVDSLTTTIEYYRGDFRLAYSPGLSRLNADTSFVNHVLAANWYYADDASLGLTVGFGREVESTGNGQVLETDVHGMTVSGRTPLNDRIALTWWAGVHDQGGLYRRRFIGMALSVGI